MEETCGMHRSLKLCKMKISILQWDAHAQIFGANLS